MITIMQIIKTVIGYFTNAGICSCGRSFWRNDVYTYTDKGGVNYKHRRSYSSGIIFCDECIKSKTRTEMYKIVAKKKGLTYETVKRNDKKARYKQGYHEEGN